MANGRRFYKVRGSIEFDLFATSMTKQKIEQKFAAGLRDLQASLGCSSANGSRLKVSLTRRPLHVEPDDQRLS